MKKKLFRIAFLASLIFFVGSVSYYVYFKDALLDGWWLDVDGFTRIVIPDTFLYKSIIDSSSFFQAVWFSGVKNIIGPSFVWWVTGGNWIAVSFVNSLFLLFALKFMINISLRVGLPRKQVTIIILLLAALPITLYYSVGALKELPSLALLLGFFHYYVAGHRFRWVFCVLMATLFRYQLLIVLSFFLALDRLKRYRLSVGVVLLAAVSATYPFFVMLSILAPDAVESYREASPGSGLGAFVERTRDNTPIASIFAVIVRVIQSVCEPVVAVISKRGFREGGAISVFDVAHLLSFVLTFRYWVRFAVGLLGSTVRLNTERDVDRLYLLSMLYLVLVGGFSFIHHRYLFPMLPFVLIAGSLPRNRGLAVSAHERLYFESARES